MNDSERRRSRELQDARAIARGAGASRTPPLLALDEVRFGFPSRPDFLGPVSVTVGPGECWAIVGPNGAGKSTLLRLMAGLWRPRRGAVHLLNRPLGEYSGRQRARRIAFLPQHPPADLDLTVRQVVLMGRFPHRSMGLFESAQDEQIAERAMRATGTLRFAGRRIHTLSGGEAQRVHLAAALAQEPRILLLDEPTASLDLQHQLAIFQILSERSGFEGLGVVVVTHDVNLAARFCSGVLLLDDGRVAAQGRPDEALAPALLSAVYGVELLALPTSGDGARWLVPAQTGEVRE